MPFFIVLAPDRPGALPDRLARRQDHLDYWTGLDGVVKVAGAMLNADGPSGSAFLIEAADADDAKRLLASDPFMQAGIFAGDVTVVALRPAIGEWLPAA